MSNHGFEVVAVSSGGKELDEVAEREGVKTIALEMTRTLSPLKDLVSLWKFYRLCKKEKPDIVHSHTPKAGIIAMLGAKLAGVPIRLHTVAGLPLMETGGIKRKVLDCVEKLTYACATKVYPNSIGLCEYIVKENFTSPSKIKVIGNGSSNGIDIEYFTAEKISQESKDEIRKQLNLTDDDFVFVFIGRIVGDKGINELVQAFQTMTNDELRIENSSFEIRNSKLLLVGPLEQELDPLKPETLKEIDNNPNIISVGFQEDVRPYFAISNCLVFPSYREGFPNVVLQAGAMELPAIVTNINGCNEIIIPNENGFIIPPKDENALQNAMIKMLNEKEIYKKMKGNARNMISQRYSQAEVWKAILEEYRSLINSSKI